MKRILFTLVLALVFTGCSPSKPESLLIDETNDVAVVSIKIELTGNETVDAEIKSLIDQKTAEVKEAGAELQKLGSAGMGGLYVKSEKFSSVDDVRSILLTVSENTGGAHPNTYFYTWTYQKNSGEILKFRSLFQTEHNPLSVIFPIVQKQLSKLEYADPEWITRGTGDADFANYKSFVLDGENLIILFPPYQVTAYAAGPQKVSIPLIDLQVILKPPFLKAKELPQATPTDHASICTQAKGTWMAEYKECEYAGQDWCEQEMGVFHECESACRHDAKAEVCTIQCVPVCKF